MIPLFGPAGNADSFRQAGFRSSLDAPGWLSAMGLDAFEYQCGRGVGIGGETCAGIGRAARSHRIVISLHSPYFINLSSCEPDRIAKNNGYILQSARAASLMGGDRVVVHCGGLSGRPRGEALENTVLNLSDALSLLDDEGLSGITLCIETMGKSRVLGTAEEVCEICARDSRLLPCIDFGHLNARGGGALTDVGDFMKIMEHMIKTLGFERVFKFHCHFSKIEYSSGGEIRHLTFEDTVFGPDYRPFIQALHESGLCPRVICESSGTQAEDALTLKTYYLSKKEIMTHDTY